jgi:hypothetical protein
LDTGYLTTFFVDNTITFPPPVLLHDKFQDKQGTEPSISTISKSENAKTFCHVTNLTYSESPKGFFTTNPKSKPNLNHTTFNAFLQQPFLSEKSENPNKRLPQNTNSRISSVDNTKKLRLRLSAA